MQDLMGRSIDYLRVSVTDRCNLRCVYCMPPEGIPLLPRQDLLSFEEIERVCICAAKLGITKLKLTGGEPLTRQGLPDLARRLRAIPGIQQITITTNGVLLKEYAQDLAHAGIEIVNISLDSFNPSQFFKITCRDCFPQVLNGISAALSAGLQVRINCVPSYASDREDLLSIAKLAKDSPIDVRFIEEMPIGQGHMGTGLSSQALRSLLVSRYGPLKPTGKKGNGRAVYETLEGFTGRIGFISAVTEKFCHCCNRIRLTSSGFLKLCLDSDQGLDLRQLLRDGIGNEELVSLMKEAITHKPEGHQFGAHHPLPGSMAQIGG